MTHHIVRKTPKLLLNQTLKNTQDGLHGIQGTYLSGYRNLHLIPIIPHIPADIRQSKQP
jgi:hypothetical protein